MRDTLASKPRVWQSDCIQRVERRYASISAKESDHAVVVVSEDAY
jgi:hypothetical protein